MHRYTLYIYMHACVCTRAGYGKGAQGNAAGMSGSCVTPRVQERTHGLGHPAAPLQSRLRACGCARPERSLPAVGTRACAWESQQPCHRPGRETSRIYWGGGGGERIAKKGQYLQAAHCSSISGPCREEGAREMYFFRSRQRSAPAPIAGMRHFPRAGPPAFCRQSPRSLCSFSPRTRCESSHGAKGRGQAAASRGCGASPILAGVTPVVASRGRAASLRSDSLQQHVGTFSSE